jgi:outer membrane protein assembly factor BamD
MRITRLFFKILPAFLYTLFVVSLSACGSASKPVDETAGWSASRLYAEAKEEIAGSNYQRAITLLEKLEARYPFGRYAQQAQLEIVYVYYKDNDPVQALAAADRFIKLHPNHPNVDYVYYLKGLINFNDNLGFLAAITGEDPTARDPRGTRNAFDAFKLLITRFPNSQYAADATLRMKYLINAMGSNELQVARYYFKRGAYLAAANRSQSIIKQYQQTPATEEALYILVKSYDALGLPDLKNDAHRILVTNYPNSIYLDDKVFAMQEEKLKAAQPWWKIW